MIFQELCIDRGEVNKMSKWVLKINGNLIPKVTYWMLRMSKSYTKKEDSKCAVLDALTERIVRTSIN